MKRLLIGGSVMGVVLLVSFYAVYQQAFAPTDSQVPTHTLTEPDEIRIVADNLEVPWEVRILPAGDVLVTERTGSLVRIAEDGSVQRVTVPAIVSGGEGGLLGLVLHPNFVENRWIYLYRTAASENGRINQVVRYQYQEDHTLTDETIILDAIPGARYHDGGRLEFGPDGYLYVTTGDAGVPELAQATSSLAGKILRITDTGAIPADNPYQNHVYSYGHRNPQGIAWDEEGRLWSTEHGRSGLQSGMDELNLIYAGGNYGWPVIEGDEENNHMLAPLVHSGPDETWAPASLAIAGSDVYFAGLRGESLYQATLQGNGEIGELTAFLRREYGRLRTVRVHEDVVYLLTSNTDGRGRADANDDVLLSVPRGLLTP